jgi:hypothetical protein
MAFVTYAHGVNYFGQAFTHLKQDLTAIIRHSIGDARSLLEVMETVFGLGSPKKGGLSPEDLGRIIDAIRALTPGQRRDAQFLENDFIPYLGLNDEHLEEQPVELLIHTGQGLKLWQYPNQLARLLVKLADSQENKGYLEIGCRWGGTFVLLSEWLYAESENKEEFVSTAVDLIPEPTLIANYASLCKSSGPKVQFIQGSSSSADVVKRVSNRAYGTVLIDGDHSTEGVLSDHLHYGRPANRIIHHDIDSDAVPNLRILWKVLVELETERKSMEFVEQYLSVRGSFLGIGLLEKLA